MQQVVVEDEQVAEDEDEEEVKRFLRWEVVVATGGCEEELGSFGGVMSFMVSLAFKNSSSSSVVQELMGAVVPYLSSVVILKESPYAFNGTSRLLKLIGLVLIK